MLKIEQQNLDESVFTNTISQFCSDPLDCGIRVCIVVRAVVVIYSADVLFLFFDFGCLTKLEKVHKNAYLVD